MTTSVFDLASDPALFNPLQLQPRGVLWLAFNSSMGWLRDHAISHGKQVKEHRTGWVVHGLHVEYKEPLGYHDADTISVWGGIRLIKRASQIDYRGGVTAAGRTAVDVRMVWAALALSEGEELAGLPDRAAPSVISAFPRDCVDDDAGYSSPIARQVERIKEDGALVVSGKHPFFVHRHNCEVADQWFYGDLPGFVGAAREALVMREGQTSARVRVGMERGMTRFDAIYSRAAFLFDSGFVETEVYELDDKTAFIHRLIPDQADPRPYATLIEEFPPE